MSTSLRARLLAASLVLVAFGLLAADIATYTSLRSFLHRRLDNQLLAAEANAAKAIRLPAIEAQGDLGQLGDVVPGVFVQYLNARNQPLVTVNAQSADATRPLIPDDIRGRTGRFLTVPSVVRPGPEYRLHAVAFPRGGVLIVGLPLSDTTDTLHRLLLIEVFVTLVVLAGAAGLGVWVVRLGLRPLEEIETTAASITEGDMSRRVANDDVRTEVGRVGRALNTMLDAIHHAFARQQRSEEAARASEERMRQFVADASHELRTPVAAVRAYAELYRRGADTRPEDLARLLARIEQEAARMGVLVDDLLLLTRLDEGRPLEQAPVDVGAVAADAVEAAKAVEPDRPVELTVEGSVEVSGDRDRLRQVVDNLLANVRSHTPKGAPASVRVRVDGASAVLEVADHGPGLSSDEASRVFERFYRADPGRSRDRGGAGLGLPIVAAIVAAHGGSTTAGGRWDGRPGAVFRVELPVLEGTDGGDGGDGGDGAASQPAHSPFSDPSTTMTP
ncbi:MAG TPA: HAMP domain-containing sensor histidine kinase [Acidimicrobiales bacterium]|nr:HAMP domain-containing sensor histidine kinase [Acidimicrobiales bacterium]